MPTNKPAPLCGYCKKPIGRGDTFYLVDGPTSSALVHHQCMEVRTTDVRRPGAP